MLLAVEIAVTLALSLPHPVALQMPQQPGRLEVKSVPSGATVMIGGQPRGRTDVTFVVVPGQRITVSVSGEGGNPKCADRVVAVPSGQTVSLICTAQGWTR
jgi:PEGA domain